VSLHLQDTQSRIRITVFYRLLFWGQYILCKCEITFKIIVECDSACVRLVSCLHTYAEHVYFIASGNLD
jgi:hypothetical protein